MRPGRVSLDAYADAAARSALAALLPAVSGAPEVPDWIVLASRSPRPTGQLRPGRGYLGWERELDSAWRGETRRAA